MIRVQIPAGALNHKIMVYLISMADDQNERGKKELLIEECKVMVKDNLKIIKEWEISDNKTDWEW